MSKIILIIIGVLLVLGIFGAVVGGNKTQLNIQATPIPTTQPLSSTLPSVSNTPVVTLTPKPNATRTPIPTAISTPKPISSSQPPATSSCEYSCSSPNRKCSDFHNSHAEAQAFFICCGFTATNDPMGLDSPGVGDGVACESLK